MWDIYVLTPYSRVLLEKPTGSQLVKKFPTFYGTRRFITAFISARHLSLSWASSIQSILPHPTSWRSILILSSHLLLGLPSVLFPPRFPTKTLYTPLLSPIHSTCPAHLILLYFITRTILGEAYRSFSSSLCIFLHSPVISPLLGSNILLSTLFSNTLSLCSSSMWKTKFHTRTREIYILLIIQGVYFVWQLLFGTSCRLVCFTNLTYSDNSSQVKWRSFGKWQRTIFLL